MRDYTSGHLGASQLFGIYSTVISTLTQQHIDSQKFVVACQHIMGRKFIHTVFQTDYYGFLHCTLCYTQYTYLPRVVTTLNMLSRKIRNLLFILFHQRKTSFYTNFQVLMPPSCAIVKDPFPRNFSSMNTYFHAIFQYYTYSQRQWNVGYHNQDSILV